MYSNRLKLQIFPIASEKSKPKQQILWKTIKTAKQSENFISFAMPLNIQLMVSCWFGLEVWIPGIPPMKGIVTWVYS